MWQLFIISFVGLQVSVTDVRVELIKNPFLNNRFHLKASRPRYCEISQGGSRSLRKGKRSLPFLSHIRSTVSDGVSPLPRRRGGGAGSAPSKSATVSGDKL